MARSLRRAARVRPSSPAISVPVMGPLRRTISAIFSVYHLVEWDSPLSSTLRKSVPNFRASVKNNFPAFFPLQEKAAAARQQPFLQGLLPSQFFVVLIATAARQFIKDDPLLDLGHHLFVNFTASGLTDILSMPLSTRNSANSG